MVEVTPRDSLTAQMISCPATLVAVVVGLAVVPSLLVATEVNGTKELLVDACREKFDMLNVRKCAMAVDGKKGPFDLLTTKSLPTR